MSQAEQNFIDKPNQVGNTLRQINPYRKVGLTEIEREIFEEAWHAKLLSRDRTACA